MSQSEALQQQATDVAQAIETASSNALTLAIFSGLVAHAESFVTKRGLQALLVRGVSPVEIHEIVLQSYLFCGFPRMLDALFDMHATIKAESYITADSPDCSHLAYSAEESHKYERQGRELIRLIYGQRYDKLERAICGMSPDVFRLMIMEGYGKTLSRPELDVQSRELAVVAALTVDRRPRQLRAHLFGSLNVGVSVSALEELLQSLESFTSKDRLSVARHLLTEVTAR